MFCQGVGMTAIENVRWRRTSRFTATLEMDGDRGRIAIVYTPLLAAISDMFDPAYDMFDWSLNDYFLSLAMFLGWKPAA